MQVSLGHIDGRMLEGIWSESAIALKVSVFELLQEMLLKHAEIPHPHLFFEVDREFRVAMDTAALDGEFAVVPMSEFEGRLQDSFDSVPVYLDDEDVAPFVEAAAGAARRRMADEQPGCHRAILSGMCDSEEAITSFVEGAKWAATALEGRE